MQSEDAAADTDAAEGRPLSREHLSYSPPALYSPTQPSPTQMFSAAESSPISLLPPSSSKRALVTVMSVTPRRKLTATDYTDSGHDSLPRRALGLEDTLESAKGGATRESDSLAHARIDTFTPPRPKRAVWCFLIYRAMEEDRRDGGRGG